MIKRSSIGWTDFSGGDLNFVIGCTPASEGCAHCYARSIIQDRGGRDFSQITIYPEKLERLGRVSFAEDNAPFRRGPGSRPMAFVVDMGDLFHPDVSDSFIQYALWTMEERQDVDWHILTKRPERMSHLFLQIVSLRRRPMLAPNIWCGVTVENQARADERIPHLLATPAAVRFLSIEPMLGPVDLVAAMGEPEDADWDVVDDIQNELGDDEPEEFIEYDSVENPEHREWREWRRRRARLSKLKRSLSWVIVGGESGPKRRYFDVQWARHVRDVCQAADIPFFYKQGSALRPGQDDLLDGVQWKEFPNK